MALTCPSQRGNNGGWVRTPVPVWACYSYVPGIGRAICQVLECGLWVFVDLILLATYPRVSTQTRDYSYEQSVMSYILLLIGQDFIRNN